MVPNCKGSCLCGDIRYETSGEIRNVVACHCNQCRKQSGHFYAATAADDDQLTVFDPMGRLRWYQSSEQAKRGFCSQCGSALFWKHEKDGFTSILAGSIDGDTHLKLDRHIFTEFKGDYYEIDS